MLNIEFFYPRWGSESMAWHLFAQKVRKYRFSGIEVYPFAETNIKKQMLDALAGEGLSYVLLHNEPVEGAHFEAYLHALETNLYKLLDYQTTSIKPAFIVSQTGREFYSKQQVGACFEVCEHISVESSIPIIHETHRNKWSFAAHVTRDYLVDYPQIALALDISHWFCVSESYLQDQAEAIELAIRHTRHLHARIGHLEGPQVSDPRSPEHQEALRHHLEIWDQWINLLRSLKVTTCTITPEFGPFPYMAYKPFTFEPVSDQWEINCWMRDILEERYVAK